MRASFDSKQFRRACGQFLTGVTIVTARAADDTPLGLTANSFASVSLNPSLVLVCLDKSLWSYQAFRASHVYAVHVLAADQSELASRFAARGADKFGGMTWREGLGGVPILPDFLALFECYVAHIYDGGDHTIFVGRVERIAVADEERLPLGFFQGQYTYVPQSLVSSQRL